MEENNSGEFFLPSREYLTAVGSRLRIVRKRLGVTQKAAAAAVGISQPFLSAVERGQKAVSTAQIVSLIRFYRVPYELILGDIENTREVELAESHDMGIGFMLLEQLIGEANSKELADGAAECINMCAYVVFRTVYRLNPHNSERPFSISYEDAVKAANAAMNLAPEKITRFIGSAKEIKATSFELPMERNDEMRAFIKKCETMLKRVLEDN